MFLLYHGLIFLVYHVAAGLCSPATYDQRQTGDLNVQIHLKDVRVVALLDSEILDDYTDYDYIYDYADFTIKPTKPSASSTTAAQSDSSTSAPSSATTDKTDVTESVDSSSQNSTESSIPQTSGENITLEVPSIIDRNRTDETSSTNSTDGAQLASALNESTDGELEEVLGNDDKVLPPPSNALALFAKRPAFQMSRKRCRSGFSSDGKGRCRRVNRRRTSFLPIALKLAPKFFEKVS